MRRGLTGCKSSQYWELAAQPAQGLKVDQRNGLFFAADTDNTHSQLIAWLAELK